MPSEIEQLPDLQGFLKLASRPEWLKMALRHSWLRRMLTLLNQRWAAKPPSASVCVKIRQAKNGRIQLGGRWRLMSDETQILLSKRWSRS